MTSVANTVGKRVFLIRLALGDEIKKPMPMEEFGELLSQHSTNRKRWDSSMVSRIESGVREVSISEAELIAALDPYKRGFLWLARGEGNEQIDPRQGRRLDDEELSRAATQAAAIEAAHVREAAEHETNGDEQPHEQPHQRPHQKRA